MKPANVLGGKMPKGPGSYTGRPKMKTHIKTGSKKGGKK